MKKLYILALGCTLVAGSANAGSQRHFVSKKGAIATSAAPKAATPLWRPGTVVDYYFDLDEEDWLLLSTTTNKYDSRGNNIETISDEDGDILRKQTTYDANNNPLTIHYSEGADGEYVDQSRRTYVYDPIVKDYFIERTGEDWDGAAWVKNTYCETNKITRNDGGNITDIVKSLLYMGQMTPAYKFSWHYDATTGKADEYRQFAYDPTAGEWNLYDDTEYKEIQWESTDGQMVKGIDELLAGPNRIKQAKIYYDGTLDGHYIVKYSATNPNDYTLLETFADPDQIGRSTTIETIDANGSIRMVIEEYFDEDNNPTEEPTYTCEYTTTLDSHGNEIGQEIYEDYGDGPELVNAWKAECTYDNNGNLTEMTSYLWDPDLEELVPDMRTVYSDYIDVAGLTSAKADLATAAGWSISGSTVTALGQDVTGLSIINLQGCVVRHAAGSAISTEGLAAGAYIVTADGAAGSARILIR